MTTDPALLNLLERIARSLEAKNGSAPVLGLTDRPALQHLYVGQKGDNSCWYRWKDEKAHPITANALAGYLVDLKTEATTYEGKTELKLRIYMKCGSVGYCIQAGLDTVFSRGVLLALAQLTAVDLLNPIMITVRASDQKQTVVFGNVLIDGQSVKSEWDENVSCLNLFHSIAQKFNLSLTEEQPNIPVPQPQSRKALETDLFQIFNSLQRQGVSQDDIKVCARSLFPHFTTTKEMKDDELEKLTAHLQAWSESFAKPHF